MKKFLLALILMVIIISACGCSSIFGNKNVDLAKTAWATINTKKTDENVYIIHYTYHGCLTSDEITDTLFREIPTRGICVLFCGLSDFKNLKAVFFDEEGKILLYKFDYRQRYYQHADAGSKLNLSASASYLSDCNYFAQMLLDAYQKTGYSADKKYQSVPANIENNTWYRYSDKQAEQIFSTK